MPSQIESSIEFLRETCNTESAFFSFTTDDSGEHGIIKANKEGLRLYAMELLKKSVEMESSPENKDLLFFDDQPWMIDDAGYHLIWGVDPTSYSRKEILSGELPVETPAGPVKQQKPGNTVSGWIPSLIILSGGLVIVTIAAFKWFH
jgi:hypothetical protein